MPCTAVLHRIMTKLILATGHLILSEITIAAKHPLYGIIQQKHTPITRRIAGEVNEMKTDSVSEFVSQYVAVFRASSAPMFPLGTQIEVHVPRPLGTVILTFRTRHIV